MSFFIDEELVMSDDEIEDEIENDNLDDFNEKEPKISFEQYVEQNQIDLVQKKASLSAALYIAGDDGLDLKKIIKVVGHPLWFTKKLLKIMIDEYWINEEIGIAIEVYQKIYKFVTKPKCFNDLSKIINTKYKNPLSQSVMETLAIIAYNQPCRRSVIEKIRGKDPKAAIDKLLSLELITGKASDAPGHPFEYYPTNKFYDLFDIKSTLDLPRIEKRLLTNLPTDEDSHDETDDSMI